MNLTINGESRAVADGRSLVELLRELGLENRPIAVELNQAIVRKPEYPATALRDGDTIEIVHFVGGG